ncbi:hypothetical protein BC835DRAFT_1330159 [Cytidiella melzeri]|nr:hypothetical protein BC835DRAFT_1330159 [Cytidiella melzeri]
MALVVPAHRIQTIHGVFGSPSWSSILPVSGASHSHELSFHSLPNTSLTPLRNRGPNLTILATRTGVSSVPTSHTPVLTRPRRSSIHSASSPISTRRAPPPPPVQRTTVASALEDPFADKPVGQDYVIEALPSPRAQTRTTQSFPRTQLATYTTSSYSYPTTAVQRAQREDQRTAKLVASVLLNRASGKPMRRRFPSIGEKSYVKSGLSHMVAVEC